MRDLNILRNINRDWGNYNRIEGRFVMRGEVKVKVKFTLEQATKALSGDWRYSCALSLTLALVG